MTITSPNQNYFTDYVTNSAVNSMGSLGIMGFIKAYIILLVISFILLIWTYIMLYKLFEKMGIKGWKALIPFYNYWLFFEKMDIPAFLAIIPGIQGIASLVAYYKLGKKCGKSNVFSILLALITPVMLTILLFFDKDKENNKDIVESNSNTNLPKEMSSYQTSTINTESKIDLMKSETPNLNQYKNIEPTYSKINNDMNSIANMQSNSMMNPQQNAINSNTNSMMNPQQNAMNSNTNSMMNPQQNAINSTANSMMNPQQNAINSTANSMMNPQQNVMNSNTNSMMNSQQNAMNSNTNSIINNSTNNVYQNSTEVKKDEFLDF